LVAAYARTINVADLELRLDVVERKLQQTLDTVGDELKHRR
jgi:hypothetical protein